MEKDFIKDRFVAIRTAKDKYISARSLSLELGQSSQYINQIESGRKMPSIEGLLNFCDYFNISLSEFFDEEQKYPIQYKELLQHLNKLDSQELSEVMAIVKRLANKK